LIPATFYLGWVWNFKSNSTFVSGFRFCP